MQLTFNTNLIVYMYFCSTPALTSDVRLKASKTPKEGIYLKLTYIEI